MISLLARQSYDPAPACCFTPPPRAPRQLLLWLKKHAAGCGTQAQEEVAP